LKPPKLPQPSTLDLDPDIHTSKSFRHELLAVVLCTKIDLQVGKIHAFMVGRRGERSL